MKGRSSDRVLYLFHMKYEDKPVDDFNPNNNYNNNNNNNNNNRGIEKHIDKIPGKINITELQKIALLGSSHILRKVLSIEWRPWPPIRAPDPGLDPALMVNMKEESRRIRDNNNNNNNNNNNKPSSVLVNIRNNVCWTIWFCYPLFRLSYKLTHLYYNWPGTVRVPAPCQVCWHGTFFQSMVKQSLNLSSFEIPPSGLGVQIPVSF